MKKILYSSALSLAFLGCTSIAPSKKQLDAELTEHSRTLTTGIVDALQLQPLEQRDVYAATALELARQDQRLEGLPGKPLEAQVLTGPSDARATKAAWAALRADFEEQDRMLAKQRKLAARLEGLGAVHEEERNRRISLWTRWLTGGFLGFGGLIALAVFFPVAIPLAGRFLGWVVGKLPALAGAAGVVSVKAFDAVVRGIERAKRGASSETFLNNQSMPVAPTVSSASGDSRRHSFDPNLELSLSRAMDAEHKALVRKRKYALQLI